MNKFEYKIGDFVRCKKDLGTNMKMGSYHRIRNITKKYVAITISGKGEGILFRRNKKKNEVNFHEFFCSKKEIRKLKLDKLNKLVKNE